MSSTTSKEEKQYASIATQYAKDVVAKKIPACKWVRLACKRHIDDLAKVKRKTYPYKFDAEKVRRACKFIELQYHTKGRWARERQRLVLEPWQVFFVAMIFGWVWKHSGLRRFRRALLLVPRKNGKSALAAAIGLYMLCADGEFGAEIYSGATSEKQAWEVFRPATLMAKKNPALLKRYGVVVNASNIVIPENGSKFEPVIGKPGDGSSPSCSIIDEYHEHKTDDMVDTMETGMGAREQALSLIITTAGDNTAGPCYQMQLDAQRMLEGTIEADDIFALIYTIDAADKNAKSKGDDWTKLDSLIKANPNFDVSVDKGFLETKLKEAIELARKQSTFKTKHLNIWVGSMNAYYNVEKWKQCANTSLSIDQFKGRECVLGLDLASKVDIAALEILFPDPDGKRYTRFGRYYLPEATVYEGDNEHYRGWANEGRLVVTDGEIIDFERIQDDILDLCRDFSVREVAYDPHQATMLVTSLINAQISCVEVRPTVLNFSEPMKTLDALIKAGNITHDDDPVMTWMISNVVAKEDAKDNVYPRKERPENKIDGVVANLMALARCIVPGEEQEDLDELINQFDGL